MASITNKTRILLSSLYKNKYDISTLVSRFTDICKKYKKARPEVLLNYENIIPQLWYKKSDITGYILYVDLFSPEANNGAYIKALIDKLSYFSELGITLLHILPVLKNSGDAGYAVDDYTKIDSRYGNNDDFIELINKAHEKGIRIIFDFVLNHTSDNHEWAIKAKKGERHFQNYYIFDKEGKMWPKVGEVFPDFAPGHWDWVPELKTWAWSTFYKRHPLKQKTDKFPFGQWDLNYKNPEVFFAMLENLLNLANWGIDVFRLDAIPFLWKEKGTDCNSLAQTYEIIKLFRIGLNTVAPKAIFLAEAYQKPQDLIKYFGDGDGVQTAYHFTLMPALWYAAAFSDNTLLYKTLNNMPKLPPNGNWFVFTECHDQVSLEMLPKRIALKLYQYFVSSGNLPFHKLKKANFARGVSGTTFSLLKKNIKLIMLLESVKATLGYTPIFYQGEELGLENDFLFLSDPLKREDTRFVKRFPITSEVKERRNTSGTKEYVLFEHIKYLNGLRLKYPLISQPPEILRSNNKAVFSYAKTKDLKKISFYANFSSKAQVVLLTNNQTKTLEPYEFYYFIN